MEEHQALFGRTFKEKWTKTASVHQSASVHHSQISAVCVFDMMEEVVTRYYTTARPPRIGPIAADFRDGAALAK